MNYDKYFTKHQELLHLLAESPIVESVQALTYKTVKIHFSEALNDEHIRQLQGFILAQAGIYSYIGTSTVSDRNAHQALEKKRTQGVPVISYAILSWLPW